MSVRSSSLKVSSRPRRNPHLEGAGVLGMLLRVILWPQHLGMLMHAPIHMCTSTHINMYTDILKIGMISLRKRNSVFSCSGFDSVVNPQYSWGIDSRTWEIQDCSLSLHKMACMIFACNPHIPSWPVNILQITSTHLV